MKRETAVLQRLLTLGTILGVSLSGLGQESNETVPDRIPLAGFWQFQLDREDAGLRESWFDRPKLSGRIQLPGALQAQGFGDEISIDTPWTGDIVDRSWFTAAEYKHYRQPGNIKIPFWLQPKRYYKGPAWYQREIEIPGEWRNRRVVLTLERPHWETRVWLDGRFAGTSNALSAPHLYDLGTGIQPGRHRLTIRVDNRVVVGIGVNSHSISDHTQGNWNGIIGDISISSTPRVWIDDLQVYPDVGNHSLGVKVRIGNSGETAGRGLIHFAMKSSRPGALWKKLGDPVPASWNSDGGASATSLQLDESVERWDEFRPKLYDLKATLDGSSFHSRRISFGLREIRTEGTQLVLNGRKIFLRGTLECAIFPLTGHPPTDVESWRKVIRTAKAHGLNHIRFHSWCPPEAAFAAADDLGLYFQVECSSWANQGVTLGDGAPVDRWLYEEADRILKAYGNHPSFLLLAYGNEPAGDHHKSYLGRWVNHYRRRDSRRLYTSASGWPQIPENEFHVTPTPRIQGWGQGLDSRINARPPETQTDYREYLRQWTVPVISHEIGQWCVFPNFEEMIKYRGYLKPMNFEIFRDRLEANHMLHQARDFLLASGKLQALCYKEDIESALRTPGMGGFQLLDLHDFPGQGTALVGILDPFWEEKGYIRPNEFRRFCNSSVPLARLNKRVFTSGETLEADLEVAHFGPVPLSDAAVSWKVVGPLGNDVSSGTLPTRHLPIGSGTEFGQVKLSLSKFQAPARYTLQATILETTFENDWDFWVYPDSDSLKLEVPGKVRVTRELDAGAIQALDEGQTVFWMIPPARVSGDTHGQVATGFSSIFWNTAWTNRQAPHTLGILCDPQHPALTHFPTEFHSNWQWWYLVHRGQAMILDGLPVGLRPIVQVIDDWFTSRRLGLVFEARVGEGRILVCSVDLPEGSKSDPVSRQMLYSLFAYLESPRFAPEHNVTLEELQILVASRGQ